MTVGGDTPFGTWTITTGAGTLNDMGDGTATYTAVAGDITTDVVLTYTFADLNGCGAVSDDVMLTINDAVATVDAGVDETVCVDDEATVSGTIMTIGGDTPFVPGRSLPEPVRSTTWATVRPLTRPLRVISPRT